ncbi:uncharacterized protein LOC110107815 [Dendrobium catenatum]|uniref:TLDc domain-containing protein n=1 Tax=Dendrobium catenatum TaxID=906689 RepID=A0A2I0X214_9ASPA|nr:uncharacterized protein LOC110107815 [Dendrobium catenatum]PKU81949.1 hypothetical protein MA16_Dca003966 [Dendrobium catenatum]
MGSAASTDRRPSAEQQEQESLAASTGSLTFLKSAFANLSDHQSQSIPLSSLYQSLSIPSVTLNLTLPSPHLTSNFSLLLPHLGAAAADFLFATVNDTTDWTTFLRGFNRCCARMSASSSLITLYRIFSDVCRRAGIGCGLEFDLEDADVGKVRGTFGLNDMLMFLWLCWVMEQSSRLSMWGKGVELVLPDLNHLVLSAFLACSEVGGDESVWGLDGLGERKIVAVQKLNGWILATLPGLASCFSQFLREKIKYVAVSPKSSIKSNQSGCSGSSTNYNDSFLLTFGRAWAISLTEKGTLGEELSAASFPGLLDHKLNNLLYRSSTHGKGLSRFWSIVEGYHGPLLFLFSGNLADSSDDKSSTRRWVVGVLTENGFQNSDMFYGTSAHLYAISPVFRVLSPTGKEKNFLYSHVHPTGRVYEANPKPVGLAFGGTRGNERIFIDEDFSRVVIRHHAVDKTYQHGSLIPNQGYLAVEASLVEAEVWAFGGSSAKEQHDTFKKRENLFTEQRRKVDLKTFGSWEDSPEKMMMDMVSDPNRVRREDR